MNTKRKEKKRQKAEQKRRKKLRSILDWMEVENVTERGIQLIHNGKKYYVKGVEILPTNIFMMPLSERMARIRYFASAIDALYEHTLYFKFIKAEPDMITYSSRFTTLLEREQNSAIRHLIEMQIDKLELFSQAAKELRFYVLIQEDELHIEKAWDDLTRAVASGVGVHMYKDMQYTDYQNVIKQEFENEYVDEYLFTHAVLPFDYDKGDDLIGDAG